MAQLDPKSIGAHIRTRRQQLTPLELKVLDRILAKPDFSETTPLKEVAEENQVSEAMIVKIAKKLEFSGFRDFRSGLAYYKQLEVANLHNEISEQDTSAQLIKKVFETSIQALEETMAILDIEAFDRCVEIVANAQHIDLLGIGGSAQIAKDMAHKFLRIGIKASVYDDSHMMLMSSAVCNDQSCVIAISHSGTTIDVIEPVQLARKNGAKTIVITNYAISPITQYADVVLTSTSQGSLLLGENAASRVAQLNILDALYVAVAKRHLNRAENYLAKTRAAVESKRIK
ncbi:MurR/RpiR family transcriptional regulator [Lonepinella koalarum]|uniref:RpiR family transcriptional regulator n=1 Tax=Lonepinella koalarum TaxID=53417 RepID=A0A4V2PUN4_9PAST|nr:MurR/RpiR family transcriptional regulator [Lonepinella koalarum]MDH2926070.1 RpiR family transcriptional regulator [Lonepinella koalarum]TCK71221.1 RpiR family transcriptional regulator [Lonepinella koalarum]TFJ90947.1 MurR/RpiR family transcriptional regulator [Lonepinella koalarum]